MSATALDIYTTEGVQHLIFNADEAAVESLLEDYRKLDPYIVSLTGHGVRLVNSAACRAELERIEDAHSPVLGKKLRRIRSTFEHAPEGSVIQIFLANDDSYVERRAAVETLRRGYDFANDAWKPLYNDIYTTLSRLRMQFEVLSYGWNGEKVSQGEFEKPMRVCRFCGRSMPDVTFKDGAHAIQDSMGNKLLKCLEECDDCNHELNWIEDSFLRLMDFSRSMYGISRKKSAEAPIIIGRNYTIRPDENTGEAQLYVMAEEIPAGTDTSKPFVMKMDHKTLISNQNIYRALCKMVVDLAPADLVPEFAQAIDWIRHQYVMPDTLLSHYSSPLPDGVVFDQPVLDLFINRGHAVEGAPLCTAILYACDMAYMWVMPMVVSDNGHFKYDADVKGHIRHMIEVTGRPWTIHDSYDCRESFAHKYWLVDPSQPNVFIRPKSDPVFDESNKAKTFPAEAALPQYDPSQVKITGVKAYFRNKHGRAAVSRTDARDVDIRRDTFHTLSLLKGEPVEVHVGHKEKIDTLPPPSHVIKISDGGRRLCFWSKFSVEKFAKKHTYFEVEFEVEFTSDSPNAEFTPETAVLDHEMHEDIRLRAYQAAELKLQPKRAGTPFAGWSIMKLIDSPNDLDTSGYLVTDTEPRRYFTYNSLHFRGPAPTDL